MVEVINFKGLFEAAATIWKCSVGATAEQTIV